MIKVFNESFKNFPSWLKKFLSNRGKYVTGTLSDKFGIDLSNAEVTPVDNPKDPGFKDPDNIVLVDLSSASGGASESCYIYKLNYDGSYNNITDVFLRSGVAKKDRASKNSVKTLLSIADHMAFINIPKNKKAKKDRYQDPRYDNKGNYAGQYKNAKRTDKFGYTYGDDNWHTRSGRDKSGYVIPDPAKLVAKLYQFNIDNTAEVLDNYYKKILRIKNQIFDIDVRSIDPDYNADTYERCMRYFASLSNSFLKLEKEINAILSEVGTDDWNEGRDRMNLTDEEYFQRVFKFSFHKKDLDDNIHEVLSCLKKLKNL